MKTTTFDKLLTLIIALIGGTALLSATQTIEIHVNDAVTPPAQRMGWDAELLSAQELPTLQTFALDDPTQSSAGAQVALWTFAREINGGEHFPTFRQETGDCVSMGAANAVNYLQAVQIGLHGSPFRFRPAYPPWIYGVSRTAADLGRGQLGRSAGSVGSWAARTVQSYGVLAADEQQVPPYSGKIAEQWGYHGPPEQWFPVAEEFQVRTTASVTSYEQARDALANGYPVTVASNQGFRMQGRAYRGKLFGEPSGRWAHQMCFIGVDDRADCPNGAKGALLCLNSWGPAAHGAPLDGAPPGSFWVDSRTAERMLAQGDSYAFSNFDGFPLRDLDFRVFTGAPQDLVEFPAGSNLTSTLCEAWLGIDPRSMLTVAVLCGCALPLIPFRSRMLAA